MQRSIMKDKYYPNLDTYTKLSMTTFGKIKLSVIPEGVSFAVYNYFIKQDKMPSYDQFFDSCVHQCRTQNIELERRFEAFYELCRKHNVDHTVTATSYIPIVPTTSHLDVEDEFWKVERFKLTPDGIAALTVNRYIVNAFKNQMLALEKHKYADLFALYIAFDKDYESTKKYLNALHNTFKETLCIMLFMGTLFLFHVHA